LTHVDLFLARNAEKWHIPESAEEQILAAVTALDLSIAHIIQKAACQYWSILPSIVDVTFITQK